MARKDARVREPWKPWKPRELRLLYVRTISDSRMINEPRMISELSNNTRHPFLGKPRFSRNLKKNSEKFQNRKFSNEN